MNYMVKPAKYTVALAIRGTRYSDSNLKNKKPFLGALLGFNGAIFNAINGYPNNFWGWGGEDDEMYKRFYDIYLIIKYKKNIFINILKF